MRFDLPTRRSSRAARRGKRLTGSGGATTRSHTGAPLADDGRIRGISRPGGRRRAGVQRLLLRRRPSPVARRAVLVGLIFASLALLTFSYRGTGAVNAVQMATIEALQPVERGLTRAWAPIQGAYDWCARLVHAANENPKLHQRLDEAEAQLRVQRQTAAENDRLRDLLAMKRRGTFPSGYRQVVGMVIARSETAVTNSFVIDLGSDDGISVNDPVMVARGLVGRVVAVSPNAARVALLISRDQAVSAVVVGSEGGSGVLAAVANEGSPVMLLKYVTQRARVRMGDLVVTSGWSSGDLSSIYPRGIPVGVVSSVANDTGDLYKTVQVTPFANFDRIDEVMVLVPKQRRERYLDPVAANPLATLPHSSQPARRRHNASTPRGATNRRRGR